MSDTITIHNGGEAPQAAKSIAGVAIADAVQGDAMQQNGGQAPEPGIAGQPAAPANVQPPAAGVFSGGEPPLGGGVHSP
jgi:hypothetical protein